MLNINKMYSQLNPQELTSFDNLNVNFWSKKYVDPPDVYRPG